MTPWELAKETEHSHQRALFAWANLVARFGFAIAADPRAYALDTRKELKLLFSPPVPELSRLFAIHNQGHGDAIRGGKAKAEGVKAGVPDIMLPAPRAQAPNLGPWRYHGLFVELKRPDLKPKRDASKGATSADQDDWLGFLDQQGYDTAIAYGWIEAANAIAAYMGSPVRVTP